VWRTGEGSSGGPLWCSAVERLNPHPSHETKARTVRHPENQRLRFRWYGSVCHPPAHPEKLPPRCAVRSPPYGECLQAGAPVFSSSARLRDWANHFGGPVMSQNFRRRGPDGGREAGPSRRKAAFGMTPSTLFCGVVPRFCTAPTARGVARSGVLHLNPHPSGSKGRGTRSR
jgi:hypothetical protein